MDALDFANVFQEASVTVGNAIIIGPINQSHWPRPTPNDMVSSAEKKGKKGGKGKCKKGKEDGQPSKSL